MYLRLALIAVLSAALPAFAKDCPLPEGFSAVDPFAAAISDSKLPEGYVLFNLWALWCAPCREELPLLDAYLAEKPAALNVFALNLNDGEEASAALFKDLNIQHLEPHSSADTELLSRFKAVGLPYTAIIRDGEVIAAKNGILKETDSITDFITCQTGENP